MSPMIRPGGINSWIDSLFQLFYWYLTSPISVVEEFKVVISVISITKSTIPEESARVEDLKAGKFQRKSGKTMNPRFPFLALIVKCQEQSTYSESKHGIGTHAKASKSKWQFLETASAGERPQSWCVVLAFRIETTRNNKITGADKMRLILTVLSCKTDFTPFLPGKEPSVSVSKARVS